MMTQDDTKSIQRRQILLVDDDVDFTSMLKEFLLSRDQAMWTVHTADNYAAALSCLKMHPVDLVVLDVSMPVMDGMQFLTLLNRTRPGLQVVMLTNLVTEENRAFALQNGAALFLDKAAVAEGFDKIYAALETVASMPSQGFRGMLRQVGLHDVLQMECLARKSSMLEIAAPDATGRIFICDGAIVHAEDGTLQGEPALFHLLSLTGGEFQLKPFIKPARQTIDGHWETLVMEATRLHDEAVGVAATKPIESRGDIGLRPGAAGGLQLLKDQPPENRRIEEVVVCSGSNEVLYEWQAAGIERRVELLDLLATKSGWMSKTLPLGRMHRLEVESHDGRALVLLQPDRKVFVRSAAKQT